MRVVGRTIDPLPIEANSGAIARRNLEVPTFGVVFEPDIDYRFTFDLTPRYIRRVEGEPGYCVADSEGMRWRGSPEGYQTLLQGDHVVKYEFWIRDTRYGRLHGEDAWTANEYNPKTFYDGVMAENPRACTAEEALAY